MQNYQRNRAKFNQQKYDNRSTSGSEYFQQRFLPASSNINYINERALYHQQKKQNNEYEMSQQSFQVIEQKEIINSQVNSKQKANLFLSNNYSKIFKHKKDIATQQSPYKRNYLSSSKEPIKMRQRYQQPNQSIYQSPEIKVTKADNNLLKRNKSSESFYENSNSMRNSKVSQASQRFANTCESFELQKKLKLIHSTIKNQKKLLQEYKNFIQQQKRNIKKQFTLLQKQINNLLFNISTQFCNQLDKNLIKFISSMRQTKNQVQIVFYGKVQQRINQNTSTLMYQKKNNLNNHATQRLGFNKILTQIDYNPIRSPSKLNNLKESYYCSNSQLLSQINHQNNLVRQNCKLMHFYSCQTSRQQFNQLFQIVKQVQDMHKSRQILQINTIQKIKQTTNRIRNRFSFTNQC